MAVINGLKAKLVSFTINNAASNLQPNVGTYGTSDILNGGELLENELVYLFEIQGLIDHTIKDITVKSLLLDLSGELMTTSRNMSMYIDDFGNSFVGNFTPDLEKKTLISTTFSLPTLLEENTFNLELHVSMNSSDSCYYGLQSLLIDLADIDYSVLITFTGPTSSRTASSIKAATLVVTKGADPVTFSKDPTTAFDPEVDSVEGRVYFRQYGIYVDGYQYGTVAPATEIKPGITKLKNTFETDDDGVIIPPLETGVAATPQLVYNTIATLKNYTDELVAGILAPDVFIEEKTTIVDEETQEESEVIQDRQLLEKITFSDEFESTGDDNRIHIKWLEII